MSRLDIPIGIPESSYGEKTGDYRLAQGRLRTGRPGLASGPHLHVVVQRLQEAVVLVIVQGGRVGRAAQEDGTGVVKVQLLGERRRGQLRDTRQASAAQKDPGCEGTPSLDAPCGRGRGEAGTR